MCVPLTFRFGLFCSSDLFRVLFICFIDIRLCIGKNNKNIFLRFTTLLWTLLNRFTFSSILCTPHSSFRVLLYFLSSDLRLSLFPVDFRPSFYPSIAPTTHTGIWLFTKHLHSKTSSASCFFWQLFITYRSPFVFVCVTIVVAFSSRSTPRFTIVARPHGDGGRCI